VKFLRSLRTRMALVFAAVVACALLLFGGAALGVLVLEIRRESHREEPDEEDIKTLHQALKAMALTAPIAIGGAALVGMLLARRALAPMREASDRARLARASSLDLALPVRGTGDEWDVLATTLNDLLRSARESMDRIQRFTSDAAHELRTPLTSIIGEADVALRRERSADELRAALVRIRADAARMSDLAAALLTLARADAGALLPSRQEVDLGSLIEELVARLSETSPTARIHVALDGSPLRVAGDRRLLAQALENLMANAIRHGRSPIEIRARAEQGRIVISVTDDGPGFPATLATRMFERFARGDEARAGEGVGLGLSIAQMIAVAHGGGLAAIEVARGARLDLTLPSAGS
jgi:two-component system heavy metal sensor histidine kinase CusS